MTFARAYRWGSPAYNPVYQYGISGKSAMVNSMEPTIVQIKEASIGDSKKAGGVSEETFWVIKSILGRLHAAHALARSVISALIHNTYTFIWLLIEFFIDICFFWVRSLYRWYTSKDPLKEYVQQLENVPNYREWYAIVSEIDKITNMDLWRQNFISKHYDYILLNERLKHLREARISQNSSLLMSLLRSGLIRNFGGISQKRLFTKSYLGTKIMIEEYIEEVLRCLKYLDESITSSSHDSTFIMNSKQLKIDFFHDARQSFGCTALLLQGGSLFGLCHVGVVRALYFRGLLPRIVCGSAVGAAVASLVCTLSNAELIPILVSISDVMKGIDLLNHDVDERYGNVIENVIKKGYSQDILIFLKFVRDTIGDQTFEEAYLKTDKVLNIIVHPKNQAVPSLLNYITSPNVIIWTAIYASIGTGVLSDNVQLYVKDFNNQIVPKTPLNVTFLKPQDVSYSRSYFNTKPTQNSPKNNKDKYDNHYFQTKETSPYTRLTELFNVNHFIISLARPYLAPLISNDLKHYHSYGEFRYDRNSSTSSSASVVQNGAGSRTPSPKDIGTIVDERYTKDSSSSLLKLVKNLIGMEIQHRLVMMNKLGMLTDVMKRFFIDEKPSSLQALSSIREVTIVPELRYLLKDFGRVFDVHKTMENIPYWVLVGERSVWPLFPMLWTRCAIEFALDDLYNIHRKRNG